MQWKRTSLRARAVGGTIGMTVTAAVVATAIATPARAATDPLLAAVFDWMDANHDGKLSVTEFLSSRGSEPLGAIGVVVDTRTRPANEAPLALFARLDTNHDGAISLSEFTAEAVA